ncbi:protein phosphatase Slingshot homolog 2b isoform X2 [Myripristis murdjan]|uniref:protein phosphatase Slingshot homolog 2b isoform X2 n=1 Tax=Myripristis murdjan TaxID=586833 RepID=UPI001175FC39|nr:protein phosphatase Slingshot homolog 2-like isoform X2 [Myripristis murdjan]
MALVTVQRSPTPSTSSSPCVSESGSGEDDRRSQPRSISESFLTVKGAALFLPRGNGSSPSSASRFSQLRSKHAGDLQQHLQTMFTLLRPEDNIKLAVRLESAHPQCTRYMVVVSTNGRQDTEESVVLGMDFSPTDSSCSVGLVLPLWSDTLIHLDGDGGFSVSTDNRVHVFKPVSVQAMWSALQSLHKACEVARCHNYFPGSLFLTWVSYYQSRVSSDQAHINEWNAMQDVQSHRADSPVLFSYVPTERERTERLIKTSLREIMMQKDLENVTSKEIRTELEMHMTCNLREFKEFIDNEMIVILGQMDSPTEIFEHVYLGSEWNASNLEELQNSGVQYILNVTREIDNFFPGLFEYHNIRVYDEEATDLLAYWNDTYKFISRAKKAGAKCLVHCKMGVSRSASTVIAYAMKEYGWDLERAFDYVKERRAVTKPNPSFMRQLEEYQGILLASKQRHNKLWRSHSDSDLSEHHEPLCKPSAQPHSLGRSDPHNQTGNTAGPSLKELLQPLETSSSNGKVAHSTRQPDTGIQTNQLNSSCPEGAPALSGLAEGQSLLPEASCQSAVAQTQGELSQVDAPCPDPMAGSVPPLSAPLSNGLCDSEEESSSPPLPRPRAATVVPEARKSDLSTVTVAECVLLGQPHPPPSLHHLPLSPAPSPAPACTDEAIRPQELSSSLPVVKPSHQLQMPVSVPESSRTPTPSTQQAEPQGLSAPVPDKELDCDQQSCGLSLDSLTAHSPSTSDYISYPSAIPQDLEVSFTRSTDHINFFSAREKFQGLTQDGKTHCAAVQAVQQSPQLKGPGKDQPPMPQEYSTSEGRKEEEEEEGGKDIAVPVQVTGLKTTMHTATPPPGALSQPGPQAPQDQEVRKSKQEMEERVVLSQEEAENVKEEVKNKEEEEMPPARLTSDWTRGSVRRVTRQLEQRMKQGQDSPLPSSSPPSLSVSSSGSQQCLQFHPHSSENLLADSNLQPATMSNPQNAPLCLQGPVVRTAEEEQVEDSGKCCPMEEESSEVVEGRGPICEDRSTKTHKVQPADIRSLSTSSSFHPSVHSSLAPLSSVGFLCLEGVTELESGTDWDYPLEGLHGDIIMKETWETLCELGAFLQQVSSGRGSRARCVEQVWGLGAGATQKRGHCVQQRVREVEARIRQAGLTPPSLMKRSASLAKLGCLDLLANDLSEWEVSCTSVAPTSEQSPLHTASDESKKQRVHSSPSASQHEAFRVESESFCEAGNPSSGCSPPPNQSQPQENLLDCVQGSPQLPGLISMPTRQQYGRTHPLRRLKKRTVSTVYHTM